MVKKFFAIGTLIIAVVLFSFNEPRYGFRINQTESLPYTLFFRVKASKSELKHGSIVAFHRDHCPIFLAKYAIGFPGDSIRVEEDSVFLNDTYVGEVQKISQSGKEYHAISDGVIPNGYVFVYGNHEQSFDSRYQEFGLVKIAEIEDVLWPIF